jgi:hypothetical protein
MIHPIVQLRSIFINRDRLPKPVARFLDAWNHPLVWHTASLFDNQGNFYQDSGGVAKAAAMSKGSTIEAKSVHSGHFKMTRFDWRDPPSLNPMCRKSGLAVGGAAEIRRLWTAPAAVKKKISDDR